MDKATLTANLHHPVSRLELIRRYCRNKVVLDIGCVNHDMTNADGDLWLHRVIREVAADATGVDYLENAIAQLREHGYKAICADVTKPLALDGPFDVIVVGNLIEHLSNFDGLMSNIQRLLKTDGCVLVSTANPFYREQYFYSAFKNELIVNPEHTCWLDPVTLDQLARRFGLATSEVHWAQEKWRLSDAILNGEARSLDLFTGRWSFNRPPSLLERVMAPALYVAFKLARPRAEEERLLQKYGPAVKRLLYAKFIGAVFEAFWRLYRLLIVTSPINRHELFVSVLKRVTRQG